MAKIGSGNEKEERSKSKLDDNSKNFKNKDEYEKARDSIKENLLNLQQYLYANGENRTIINIYEFNANDSYDSVNKKISEINNTYANDPSNVAGKINDITGRLDGFFNKLEPRQNDDGYFRDFLLTLCNTDFSEQAVDIPEKSVSYPKGDIEDFTIENGVLKIPMGVGAIYSGYFAGRTDFKEAIIPSSVKSIEAEAFLKCSNLQKVQIFNDDLYFGSSVFRECIKLTEITLPKNLKSIEKRLFDYCLKLQQINIPQGVKEIGLRSFACCKELQSIDLPEELEKIGMDAFVHCEEMVAIDIPKKAKLIGTLAFGCCYNLEKARIHKDIDYEAGEIFKFCGKQLVVEKYA